MTDEQIIALIESKKQQNAETTDNKLPQSNITNSDKPPIDNTDTDNITKQEHVQTECIKQTETNESASTASIAVDNKQSDAEIIGSTEFAGKSSDKIPLPPSAKQENAIFVGDLHHLVTRKDLFSVFGAIGQLAWIQLFDCEAQLNRPFNFAFIYYQSNSDALKSIDALNFTAFYGHPCRVMLKSRDSLEWTHSNLIVRNLPPNTNSQVLHSLFERFGNITSSKVKTTNTGRTLPFGYVQFENLSSAQRAIEAAKNRQIVLSENVITADWFKARDVRPNKQIFIKNVPLNWDEQRLIDFVQDRTSFSVASISSKCCPYGKWACCAFYEQHHAQSAIRKLDGMETGDYKHPRLSVSKFINKSERERSAKYNVRDRHRAHRSSSNHHNNRYNHQEPFVNSFDQRQFGMFSLYVGDLPPNMSESELSIIFQSFGKIRTCHILEKTVDFRYGFVNFAYAEDAARALLSMNGKRVGDKCLVVKPTQKNGSRAQQIEYFANMMRQRQSNQPWRPMQQQQQPHFGIMPAPHRHPPIHLQILPSFPCINAAFQRHNNKEID